MLVAESGQVDEGVEDLDIPRLFPIPGDRGPGCRVMGTVEADFVAVVDAGCSREGERQEGSQLYRGNVVAGDG